MNATTTITYQDSMIENLAVLLQQTMHVQRVVLQCTKQDRGAKKTHHEHLQYKKYFHVNRMKPETTMT